MAKQTFTTGQVLTAAQMTSLQQTAMGGGSTTAKTTSYVLVASDAGTTVAMNAAGSTTITVNTGLFSAGDSVFIQNWGAGTTTVTAGTATVTTHGSLALSQWEGGQLYFTSSSAAIFFDISQSTGMTNPMTTTGDTIYSSSGSTPARLGIGTTGQVLTVASGAPSWATPAGGGASWSLLNSGGTTLSGSSVVTVSGISGADKIMVSCVQASTSAASSSIDIRVNTNTTNGIYNYLGLQLDAPASYSPGGVFSDIRSGDQFGGSANNQGIPIGKMSASASSRVTGILTMNGGNSSGMKAFTSVGAANPFGSNDAIMYVLQGLFNTSATISSISIVSQGGNFDAGTVYVYTSA
jgi:hypothetical protein